MDNLVMYIINQPLFTLLSRNIREEIVTYVLNVKNIDIHNIGMLIISNYVFMKTQVRLTYK